MKSIIGIFVICVFGNLPVNGQDKMERDIKIAEKILETLLNEGSEQNLWLGNAVNGSYVEGYGVIFTLPSDRMSVVVRSDGSNRAIQIKSENGESSGSSDRIEKLKETLILFIADYGKLLGELKSDERILITDKNNHSDYVFLKEVGVGSVPSSDLNSQTEMLQVEVKKTDIDQYSAGKINREELINRINIIENKEYERKPDLELLSSIFSRLYKKDLSDTYYITGTPGYEYIESFGTIFHVRVYSSLRRGNLYFMPTIEEDNVTEENRNSKVEEMYPKFLDGFKTNIVEYGRTIKSLDPDAMLMFKIRLTECRGCSIPESIDLSIEMSELQAYDERKISLETAKSRIVVKEYPN